MKLALLLSLFLVFFGCISTKPDAPAPELPAVASRQQVPPVEIAKTCEEMLEEEVVKSWRKYEVKTSYPAFVENTGMIDKILNDFNACIIGKDQSFIIKIFGKPSDSNSGILRYHFYKEGESDIMKARCLLFKMKDLKTITSVSYEDCGYKKM